MRGLIFGIRILLHIHVFMCASIFKFRGQNSVKGGGGGGENVKPGKIRNFQKWQNDNNNNNKLP